MLDYVIVTREEYDRMHGMPGMWAVYMTLRFRADLTSHRVGARGAAISWNALAEHAEAETPRGQGVQVKKPSVGAVRGQVARLVAKGLVEPVGNKDALVFLMSGHKTALARLRETQQGDSSTYQQPREDARKAAKALNGNDNPDSWRAEFEGRGEAVNAPNPANINTQKQRTHQQSSSSTGRDVDEKAGPAGREGTGPRRAVDFIEIGPRGASQASPQERAGDGDYRGRPLGAEAEYWNARPAASEAAAGGAGAVDAATAGVQARGADGFLSAAEQSSLGESSPCGALADAYAAAIRDAGGAVKPRDRARLQEWAAQGVTVQVMQMAIDRARLARATANDPSPINVGYVGSCLRSVRDGLEQSRNRLMQAPGGAERRLAEMAQTLGLEALPGESNRAFSERVQQAWDARQAFDCPAERDAVRRDLAAAAAARSVAHVQALAARSMGGA